MSCKDQGVVRGGFGFIALVPGLIWTEGSEFESPPDQSRPQGRRSGRIPA
jgi:hypothetical protein